jgi:hypothetical protein
MNTHTKAIEFVIKNGKLVSKDHIHRLRFKELLESSPEGTSIIGLFTVEKSDGTKSQLAKIHAMINELAIEVGEKPERVKLDLKKDCGLTYMQEESLRFRSFGNCSKEELSNVIENLYIRGEMVNINFRIQY